MLYKMLILGLHVLTFEEASVCYIPNSVFKHLQIVQSTALGQAEACAPVTQRALVRSPVGTCFLGEVFSGFFLTRKTNVRKL